MIFQKQNLGTMMDDESGATLLVSDRYSASPLVVHYAAFCSTGRLEFTLQICQPAVTAHNGETETSPLPRTFQLRSCTQNIFFKSILSNTHTKKRGGGDSEPGSSKYLCRFPKINSVASIIYLTSLNPNGKRALEMAARNCAYC